MTTIRYGSKGSDVKYLQNLLGGLKPDGIFGKKTEAAVREYQKTHGLVVDGIVGPKTWAVLEANRDTSNDVVIPCEDIKQFDSPHGNMVYGPDKTYTTYAEGGCCVASLAIVHRAYGLCPSDETATQTVQRLGKYSYQHGYRIKGNGTTAGLLKTNGTTYTSTTSQAKIESALRSGMLVVLLIKAGFPNGYGGNGHYICAYGIQGNTVLLRDVGSSKSSRQTAPLSKITTGLKYAYIVSKR